MKHLKIKESKIEKEVSEYARSLGFIHYKFLSTANGVPDRLFISPNGFVFFIEFKAPDQEPRPLQAHVINKIRHNKAEVFIVDNIEDGKKVIDETAKVSIEKR